VVFIEAPFFFWIYQRANAASSPAYPGLVAQRLPLGPAFNGRTKNVFSGISVFIFPEDR
jgi:hypothetical protein